MMTRDTSDGCKWWAVEVENVAGIRGIHYVLAVFLSSAREQEMAKGYRVLSVRAW